MATTKAAMRGRLVTLQNAASVDESPGLVLAIPDSFKHHTFYIKGSTGVNAGVVQPESADAYDYAGLWAAISTPVTVIADTELMVRVEGIFKFIRCRISTAIGVGTVTVTYVGS